MKSEYLLTGATGQVGRYILRKLVNYGRIVILMRRDNSYQAEQEIRSLIGDNIFDRSSISIHLGDILDIEIPLSREIVHAAGITSFSRPFFEYWKENVISTAKLAHHAKENGAIFHLISSISIAECRANILSESDRPIPHHKQSNYALSKVISEIVASEILPQNHLSIYRISDLVPESKYLKKDLRKNHWLTLLLGSGSIRLYYQPDDYEFYLISGEDLANSMISLAGTELSGTYHLFGQKYALKKLKQATMTTNYPIRKKKNGVAKFIVRKIFQNPPLASLVDDTKTKFILTDLGIKWKSLSIKYWEAFVKESLRSLAKP